MFARALYVAAALALLAYTLHRILGSAAGLPAEATSCSGCNVILVSIDTLRADRLGIYGNPRPTSPHIDRFAARSVVFDNAISQSAWTRPAHASMLTGLYPSEHGIVGMNGHRGLASELETLPAVLARQGYSTAAFTGGANMSAHFGFDRGFETYLSPGRRLEDSLPALDRFLTNVREPFFVLLHGFDAHKPYKSEAIDRMALGLPDEPARGMARACREGDSPEDLAPFLAEYDATVHRADRSIGRLLEMVNAAGVAERTVIVVTSDHGEEFLEHGRCFHIRSLYREVVHVPLIIHVPGLAARRISAPVPASAAIGPTIERLVTPQPEPRTLPGPSLAATVGGGPAPVDYVVSETSSRNTHDGGSGHVIAVTGEDEKLVWWISREREEYFDLSRDRLESEPEDGSERVVFLRDWLARWRDRHPPRVEHSDRSTLPRRLARELRALGYLR